MKRGEVTITEKLIEGDRFYFLNDKHKTVWELVEQKTKRVNWTGGFTYLKSIIKEPGSRNTKHVKGDREIVYLRNAYMNEPA